MNNSPEIQYLLDEVARIFGGRLETSTDFNLLESAIAEQLSETISAATLKRLWGYVSMQPRYRRSTLDLLARYTGRRDYRALCLELQETSGFLSVEQVLRSDGIEAGKHLEISWMPDRTIRLLALGGSRFSVEDGGRSKLRTGDIVRALEFLQGQPLYLEIEREGRSLPPYVAGRARGITGIRIY